MHGLGNALVAGLRARGHPLGGAEELNHPQCKVRGPFDLALSEHNNPPAGVLKRARGSDVAEPVVLDLSAPVVGPRLGHSVVSA
jgi:hypothetical protein